MTDLEKTIRSNIEREIAATENQMRLAGDAVEACHADFEKLAERLADCKLSLASYRARRQRLIESLEARKTSDAEWREAIMDDNGAMIGPRRPESRNQ